MKSGRNHTQNYRLHPRYPALTNPFCRIDMRILGKGEWRAIYEVIIWQFHWVWEGTVGNSAAVQKGEGGEEEALIYQVKAWFFFLPWARWPGAFLFNKKASPKRRPSMQKTLQNHNFELYTDVAKVPPLLIFSLQLLAQKTFLIGLLIRRSGVRIPSGTPKKVRNCKGLRFLFFCVKLRWDDFGEQFGSKHIKIAPNKIKRKQKKQAI